MNKRNEAIQKGEKTKQITLGRLACGDCLGLNRAVLLAGESVSCSKQGYKANHKACPQFRPDASKLRGAIEQEGNVLSEFASILSVLDLQQIRALGAVLLNESMSRKQGFQFYQRVYVRYRGTARSDYLSNFMTARILLADKERIQICSDDGKIVLTYENTGSEGPSIYSVDAFEPLKKMMLNKGRTVDPDIHRATTKALRAKEIDFDLKLNTNGIQGSITTIDRVSKSNGNVGKRGKRKSEIVDLVSIVSDIERGVVNSTSRQDGSVVLRPDKYKRRSGGEIEISEI